MVRRVCKKLVLFSLWAVLSCVAVPVFAQATTDVSDSPPKPAVQASTTDCTSCSNSNSWTPTNWIALIAAIGSAIVSVVGAQKGAGAQKTADANTSRLAAHDGLIAGASNAGASAQATADGHGDRLTAIANRLNEHGQQITTLAQNQLPPAMLASLMPRTPQ
jgi:hypothetical protein